MKKGLYIFVSNVSIIISVIFSFVSILLCNIYINVGLTFDFTLKTNQFKDYFLKKLAMNYFINYYFIVFYIWAGCIIIGAIIVPYLCNKITLHKKLQVFSWLGINFISILLFYIVFDYAFSNSVEHYDPLVSILFLYFFIFIFIISTLLIMFVGLQMYKKFSFNIFGIKYKIKK